MELQEIRNLTMEELVLKEKELRKELFNLRYQVLSGQIENPQRIKMARREIARIKTVLYEKQSGTAAQTATS
ncbi:MAG: 50S ribosomal protein L29 [Nitrospirae bacterium]|nr:50S ribosomal protein L29 [Nitrospirota bacterium]